MPIRHRGDLLRRPPLAEVAYRYLLDAIVSGSLEPGQHLNDRELAVALGMSRTPVREALKRLANMDIIEMAPNKYTRVASFSEAETVERSNALFVLYDLALLEGIAALDESGRARLSTLSADLVTAAAEADRVQVTEASFEYFLQLADATGNDLLLSEMERLGVLATRALAPRQTPQPSLTEISAQISNIHVSVLAGDTPAARAKLRELTALVRQAYLLSLG
ncbi:GntR family transcriptional regulator [Leucobacter sp. M11]|uniref:GntR family transcriptional regulator n=1 Tax=Leucobacter sp. M11 TaxID=2993565 RepID=UPI002D80B6FC|nr:GntR family transcriptional regulator [Leucobacter sp. M11]MEB4614328.1 GntR family transcriptional regulator [Leucobacter sp. M11]